MNYWQRRLLQLRQLNFRRYIFSCLFSAFSTGIIYIGMSWQIVAHDGSILALAINLLLFWLPNVLLGPFCGVIVDRYSRKKVLLVTLLGRGSSVVVIALVMIYQGYHLWLIDLLSVLQGLFFALTFPAIIAFIREIVTEDELLYANSTVDMCYEIGNIVGYGSAGFLVMWFSAPGAYLIATGWFIVAGLFLVRVSPQYSVSRAKTRLYSFFDDFKFGLQYIFKNKTLLLVYTVQLLLIVQYMTTPTLLAPFVRSVLHAKVGIFGEIEISCSVGIVLGGVLLPWFADRYGLRQTIIAIVTLLSASFIAFSFNRLVWFAEILYFLIGFGFALWALVITEAQQLTAIDFQGRVQATFNSLSGVVVVIIYLLIGTAGHWASIAELYWLEAVLGIIGVALMLSCMGAQRAVKLLKKK